MAEGSLTGFLIQQAFKSRKEAKAERARQDKAAKSGKKVDDKDRKGLFRKAFTKSFLGGLFGGKSATGGGATTATGALLSGRKKKQKQSKGSKSSGGKAKGLEKILLTGFGSLAADTTAISGGLAALTEIMNSQLGIEGDMSSNIQGINAILADQLEVQTSFLDAIGTGFKSGGEDIKKVSSPMGQTSKSPDNGSLIGSLLQRAQDIGSGGLGALGLKQIIKNPRLLLNPYVAAATIATIGGVAKISESERIKPAVQQIESENTKTLTSKDAPWYQKLGSYFAQQSLNAPTGPKNPSGLPMPGSSYSEGAVILPQNNIIKHSEGTLNLTNKIFNTPQTSKMSSGGNMFANFVSLSGGGMIPTAIPQSSTAYPMAAGGSKAMIGEAGKEAVVPLHSADSPAKSKMGMDPSMQASAGSMLAVTDQFIKSMGPLGGPVSQALGADISNLAKTFGMSQTLPNLSIGGGKFREDTTAKKGREKFLKELIAGSLEALGAKKKESGGAPPAAPAGPGSSGNPEQQKAAEDRANEAMGALPGGFSSKPTKNADGSEQQLRVSNAKIFGSELYTRQVDTNGVLPGGMEAKGVVGPGIQFRPVEGTNGSRWYDVDGRLYSWQPGTQVKELSKDEMAKGWNGKPFIRKPDTGHVRVNEEDFTPGGVYQRPPAEGEYSYKFGKIWSKGENEKMGWLTPGGGTGPFGGRAGVLPPSNDIKFERGGKVVQKPWWDFLGWVTASKEVKKGTTGIYADSPMGRISEAAAQRNKMMKELGYESGGTLTGVRSAPAPRVTPVSYAPMATAQTESTDIGAIVNIVGSQAQQPIPVMPNNEGQTTSDYVGAPMGGGLAFTVLSTSQWGG